jgi:hypothetical protein
MNDKDILFIERLNNYLVVSKANAKKCQRIKNEILKSKNQPEEEWMCFCGGDREQRTYILNFLEWLKNNNYE